MGGVEELRPVGEVGFLLFVSVQRAGCFVYCHLYVPFSSKCGCFYLSGYLGVLTLESGLWTLDLGCCEEGA